MSLTIKTNPNAIRQIDERVIQNLENRCKEITSISKNECPVITGNLRDSVRYAGVDRSKMKGYIASDCEYCAYVHMGHVTRGGNRWVPPNPFIERAVRRVL